MGKRVVEFQNARDTLKASGMKLAKFQVCAYCSKEVVKMETQELSFVQHLPQGKLSRFARVRKHFSDVREVIKKEGLLITVKMAADIADVSTQRIHELLELGLLKRVEFHGHPFITENSFLTWAESARKSGQPLNLPKTMGDKMRVGAGRVRAVEKKV